MRQIVISIETTGFEPSKGNRIVEIGAIELEDKLPTGRTYHQYICPQREIDEEAQIKHGITIEFLAGKPGFFNIASELRAFLGDVEVITYDSSHLIEFLNYELSLLDDSDWTQIDNKIVDIVVLANDIHPGQDNSLSRLCDRYYVSSAESDFFGTLNYADRIAKLIAVLGERVSKKLTSNIQNYESGKNLFIVDSFADFDEAINGISRSALCRGVSNHEYPLLPSLFRHQDTEDINLRETNLMWVFKTYAKAHLDRVPDSELEWLTIAQHHGLPTRLLDWSLSPLVACYFAVQNLSDTDAAVYVYDIGKFKKEEEINISGLKDVVAFFPSHSSKRVSAQSGMFTIHPNSKMNLESDSIRKIYIPAKAKKRFMEKLTKYGIHHGTVFPDLDGLSNYIRYLNQYS